MLGITDEEDLFINHILLIAKKHMYWCRCIKVKPSIITFEAQVKKIYQLETSIAKSSNKWPIRAKNGASISRCKNRIKLSCTAHNML